MRLTRVTAAVCLLFLGCTELSRLHASPHPVFFAPPFRFKGGPSALNGFFTSFWKLADTADSIAANTLTNNNGVTFSAGKIGNAATNFVTASQRSLSAADAANLRAASQFTISFWAKWSVAASSSFIAKDSATDREFTVDYSGGLRFYVNGGAAGVVSVTLPADSAWHNIIAWYDGSVASHHTINIMRDNGTVSTLDITTTNPPTGNANFRIGARDYAGSEGYLTGSIDAVGWAQGRIPSAAIKAAIWNMGNGAEPPF